MVRTALWVGNCRTCSGR